MYFHNVYMHLKTILAVCLAFIFYEVHTTSTAYMRKNARAAFSMTKKKRSLRKEKLKPNRASETEEQRKERLRIEDKTRK